MEGIMDKIIFALPKADIIGHHRTLEDIFAKND